MAPDTVKVNSYNNLIRDSYCVGSKFFAHNCSAIPLHLRQWRAEAAGCPRPTRFLDALENIFYLSRKLSDDLFFYQLSNFRTIRSLYAPSCAASCPGNDIFLFIFCHLPTFFYKNWPFGCPQGGCLGPSNRPHPPLHATASSSCTSWAYCCAQCTACDCCVL